MKLSRRLCQRFLDGALPPAEELAALLTRRGLEVEAVNPIACASGIVVGHITDCAPHPNADTLQLCTVDIAATEPLQLVCGAPNARKGLRVAVAPANSSNAASISGKHINAREIRGVTSAGMICSAAELGIGEDKSGIIELSGADGECGSSLDDTLLLNDHILDINITPNRGDCMSHLGIARELAAATGLPLTLPQLPITPDTDDTFPIQIARDASDACPYYGCVVLRDSDCTRPLPWQWRTVLERCDSRPVSAVVDITNYLMLLYGQPLHAFDLDKLQGGIRVRYAAAGEKLTVLDGSEVSCRADTLLIADEKKALALAGVMGGTGSGITAETRNILLEGAHFSPAVVAGRTRAFRLNSEAAFRFERGVDPLLPPLALEQAAAHIRQVCGATVGRLVSASGSPPQPAAAISVAQPRIGALLGIDIGGDEAARLLETIALPTELNQPPDQPATLTVQVPSWRFDLKIAEDIIEEICRLYGYEQLPETLPAAMRPLQQQAARVTPETRARAFFAARGFYEIISYAFVTPAWEQALSPLPAIALANPLSEDMSVMRTTLWGGLLDRALFNLNHRQEQINLFEIGRCFLSAGQEAPQQPLFAAGLMHGLITPAQWAADSRRQVDFYDAKGVLEMFLSPHRAVFIPEKNHPALHPGKAAQIVLNDQPIGLIGELHPASSYPLARDFRTAPLLFALNLDALPAADSGSDSRRIQSVSRFPQLWRDLSCLTDAALPAGQLLAAARAVAPSPPVVEVQLFDFYAGDGVRVAKGKNSCGLRFLLQGQDANLTHDDIDAVLEQILAALKNRYDIELRE